MRRCKERYKELDIEKEKQRKSATRASTLYNNMYMTIKTKQDEERKGNSCDEDTFSSTPMKHERKKSRCWLILQSDEGKH